ncbi:MAG: DUF3572 domain-containing protein [Pseudomonadota bacterium]
MMNPEAAQVLALDALRFLAEDGERLGRFLALSGMGPQDLKTSAGNPAFLGGVLDHLLSDESLLFLFAESQGIDADIPAKARRALPGAPVEQ